MRRFASGYAYMPLYICVKIFHSLRMQPTLIFWPVFGMFVLVTLVVMRLATLRFNIVKNKKINLDYYKLMRGDTEPDLLIAAARNLANLFEMPVLFYVVVFVIFSTGHVDSAMLLFSWLYVAFRAGHSFVHLTSNHVMTRFRLYFLSNICLMVLWVRTFWLMMRN